MRLLAMLAMLVTLALQPAAAQDREKAMREAQRRLQLQNQKLQQEKSQAEAQAAELKQKLEAGEAAAAKAQAEAKSQGEAAARELAREAAARKSLAADLEKSRAAGADLDAKLKQSQTRIEELARRQTELERMVAERERQAKALLASLQTERKSLASCEAKNERLYQYSVELGDRYRNKGVWEAIAQQEPVTGLKDVEIQNVLQEYRDKLDTERLKGAVQGQGQAQ